MRNSGAVRVAPCKRTFRDTFQFENPRNSWYNCLHLLRAIHTCEERRAMLVIPSILFAGTSNWWPQNHSLSHVFTVGQWSPLGGGGSSLNNTYIVLLIQTFYDINYKKVVFLQFTFVFVCWSFPKRSPTNRSPFKRETTAFIVLCVKQSNKR